MSFIKEVKEDLRFIKQIFFNKALKEYRFQGKTGPIIGIHGIFAGWPRGGLVSFMRQNNVRGVLMYLGSLTKDIDSYLPRLDEEIKRYPHCTIIGFSSGGFVALRYIEKYGWNNINKVITIATPLRGNLKKYFILGESLRQTASDSLFLKQILKIVPPKGKLLSIFAKEDRHTISPETLELNWPIIITDAKSHGDVQNHSKWFEKELKEAIGL